jgi:hypothetical protein
MVAFFESPESWLFVGVIVALLLRELEAPRARQVPWPIEDGVSKGLRDTPEEEPEPKPTEGKLRGSLLLVPMRGRDIRRLCGGPRRVSNQGALWSERNRRGA